MASLLSSGDFTDLRSSWDSALFDTCIPQTRTEGTGGYGYGKPSYANGTNTACLFAPNKTLVGEVAGAQALTIDGHILLPRDVVITNTMRLKITYLHGEAVTPPQVFEIVGGPIINHVGKKVGVKLVTDGSES